MKNETLSWRDYMYSRIAEPEKKAKPKALPEDKQKLFEQLCRAQKY